MLAMEHTHAYTHTPKGEGFEMQFSEGLLNLTLLQLKLMKTLLANVCCYKLLQLLRYDTPS